MKRISIQEYNENMGTLIDLSDPKTYAARKRKGSLNFTYEKFMLHYQEYLDKKKPYYILCTKGKVPIYLGSSFAYMAYIGGAKGMTNANGTTFFGPALTGLFIAGLVYIVVSIIIKFVGVKWLNKLLPPIVVGPTIIVIGLG